jgi:ribonuclease HI
LDEKIDEYTNVYIFTDNQSSIKAVEHPTHQSGQYIIKEILDTISRPRHFKPTYTGNLKCTPGHRNIEGNEQADKAAKATPAASNTALTITRMRSIMNPMRRP